jgi:hypothetical protein
MKDKVYCFIIIMIVIYERKSYIVVDIMKPLSSQTKINVSFGTKGVVSPEQYLSFK